MPIRPDGKPLVRALPPRVAATEAVVHNAELEEIDEISAERLYVKEAQKPKSGKYLDGFAP